MTNAQGVLRLVNWAFGLTLFTLAVAAFGFSTCQSGTTTVIYSAAVMKAGQETRPSQGASEQEWEVWIERQKPVRDVAYDVAGKATLFTTLFVGIPTALLLSLVCVILYRVRVWLRRGV